MERFIDEKLTLRGSWCIKVTTNSGYKSYKNKSEPLQFWRTYDGSEVDFVIGDGIAIEVKASGMVHGSHLRGIHSLSRQRPLKKKILVSMDQRRRKLDGIEIMPVEEFLELLWAGEIF